MALSGLAFADAEKPACTGTKTDASVRGVYKYKDTDAAFTVELTEDQANYTIDESGEKLTHSSWTCLKNGLLVWVIKFKDNDFESRAIAMSGDLMLDFGEIYDDAIHSENDVEAPLTQKGLQKIMATKGVTIRAKIEK